MKGPLTADRLFFLSSLAFVVSFVLYSVLNFVWPLPMDVYTSATMTEALIGQVSWILSLAGMITFILGVFAKRH